MSSERKRYLRQEIASDDKKQLKFGTWGEVEPTHKESAKITFTGDVKMLVSCPFCLYNDKLQNFLISTKKGISQSNAECPDCHKGMRMKSLTADWNAEQYADWVYAYRLSGFWSKCPFGTWKKRLNQMGWAKSFWDRYKQLKGVDNPEGTTQEQEEAWKAYEAGLDHE
jgi:transcription elongation factor Elf1